MADLYNMLHKLTKPKHSSTNSPVLLFYQKLYYIKVEAKIKKIATSLSRGLSLCAKQSNKQKQRRSSAHILYCAIAIRAGSQH